MTAAQKLESAPLKTEEAMITRALFLKDTIEALKGELDDIKSYFYVKFENGTTNARCVTPSGAAFVKTSNSYSIDARHLPDLKKVFKSAFPAYVQEKVTYGVAPALKKLLADADYQHADLIRNAVMIKVSPSVDFEPVTKLAEIPKKGKK